MGKKGLKMKAKKARDSGGLAAWVRSLVGALVIFLFIRVFLIETYVIDSGSMESTLLVGDFLVVNKLAIGPGIRSPTSGSRAIRSPGAGTSWSSIRITKRT